MQTIILKQHFPISHSDLVIGGTYPSKQLNDQLQLSIAYMADDLTWCLATAKETALWKNIFFMFPLWMWPFVICLAYFNAFVLYLLMMFDVGGPRPLNYHSTCLTMFSTHIVMSNGTYRPNGISTKTFYVFLLFYGFLIMAVFNSFLIQVLTRKMLEKQVVTIEEMIYQDMDVVGSLETRSLFANGPQDEVYFIDRFKYKCK